MRVAISPVIIGIFVAGILVGGVSVAGALPFVPGYTRTTIATTTELSTVSQTVTQSASTETLTATSTIITTSTIIIQSNDTTVGVTGTLSLPTGIESGEVIFNVMDCASSPITNITVIMPTAITSYTPDGGPHAIANNGAAISGLIPVNATIPMSAASPLKDGEGASGYAVVNGPEASFKAGTVYTFIVTITFQDGTIQVQPISITAQV